MIFNKKGISPVVATALLIVVAVVAVVGFSTWFQNYQSVVNSDVETQSSSTIGSTGIVGIYNNILYFRNSGNSIIGLTNIEIRGTDCVYSGSVLPNSVGQIPLDNCSSSLSGKYNIVVKTSDRIYSKYQYLKPSEVLSGSLADSPVKGVPYSTSSGLSGITDVNGVFKYKSGDSVTFNLGDYSFTVPGRNYVTPLEVVGTSNIEDLQVVNMVRLFIALDSDGNPDNGISVDSSKASAITSSLNFNQNLSDFDSSLPTEIDTSVINETFAIEHFNETLKLISGEIDGVVIESSDSDSSSTTTTLANCSLDGITIESGSNYTFYSSALPLNNIDGCSAVSEIRTCNNGTLDGDSSYIYSFCNDSKAPSTDYGEWILVPGNSDLGTSDFYVMKYEAKWNGQGNIYDSSNMYCGDGDDGSGNDCPVDGSVGVVSKPEDRPLTNIYQTEARDLCGFLGENYHLITDPEWVTIARNIELVPENWNTSQVGNGFLFSGHNDNGPSVSINASSDDSDGYYGTGDSLTSCDGSYTNYDSSDDTTTGRACAGQRRTLYLSNGAIIWDLSGNVREWTNDTFENADADLDMGDSAWHEWLEISTYTYLQSINQTWNSNNSIGRVNTDADDANPSGTTHAFHRGGYWGDGLYTGSFFLSLTYAPVYSRSIFGFRCSFEP